MKNSIPVAFSFKQFRLAVCASLAAFVKPIVRTAYSGIAASLFAVCGSAYGQVTSVDADSFAAGTVLTNAFSGVTLSVIAGPNSPSGASYVVVGVDGYSGYNARNIATTGTLVFSAYPIPLNAPPQGWEVDGRLFRADFANPTDWVSIDLIADDDDSGELRAFNVKGEHLGIVSTGNIFASAFTATITRPTADIAYITAAGTPGESMFLDNLRYNMTADITAPVLTLPASFAVDATSPQGATVNYAVTATDNSGKPPTVSCIPKSGATFPIAKTNVNCTATDAANNSSTGSFTVTVNGAAEQLSNLITMVGSVSSPFGTTNSLDAKLQNAMKGSRSACNSLGAFINEAQAQSGKKLPAGQADLLIESANQIRAVLGCP